MTFSEDGIGLIISEVMMYDGVNASMIQNTSNQQVANGLMSDASPILMVEVCYELLCS